jgi:hypothetical protein
MAVQVDPASILIEEYFSLKTLISGSVPFDAAVLKDNPPRYYRLLRFKSALAALALNCTDFLAFENGDFILEDRQLFDKVEELLVKEFELPIANYVDEHNTAYFSCASHFQMLLATRLTLHQLSAQREAAMASSGHFQTPLRIIAKMEVKLTMEVDVLQQALCILLNPSDKRFTMEEMTNQFGFPIVDLDEIDLDWY